jgi:hypothetical protein
MKTAIVISRFILGLGFIVFGLNILHPFLPQPPIPDGSLPARFMVSWGPVTGWYWSDSSKCSEAFVLFGRTAPIGLTLLGPVLVNILAFHILLMGGAGIAPGLVFSALELFLIYVTRYMHEPFVAKLTEGATDRRAPANPNYKPVWSYAAKFTFAPKFHVRGTLGVPSVRAMSRSWS